MAEVLRCIQTNSRTLQLVLLACFTAMAVIGWELIKKDIPETIRVPDYRPIFTADAQDRYFYQDENFNIHGLVGPDSTPKESNASAHPTAKELPTARHAQRATRRRVVLEDEDMFGGWEATDMLGADTRPAEATAKEESLEAERYDPVHFHAELHQQKDLAGWESTQSDLDVWSEPSQLVEEEDTSVSREEPIQYEPPPKQTNLSSSTDADPGPKDYMGDKRTQRASGSQADSGWTKDRDGSFAQVNASNSHLSGKLRVRDVVVATTSHRGNEAMHAAGRAARLGMHTYVATNYEPDNVTQYPALPEETWGHFPDDDPVRSFYPGDSRAAMAPFLAYKELGESFKWLFYGDDDTAFFVDAAINVLQGLDHNMPYIITDNLWFSERWGGARHPHERALRCLPCNYARNTSLLLMKMALGCPCTPAVICGTEGGYNGVITPRNCVSAPRTPVYTYSLHGGAGALISVGLLRNVPFEPMRKCVTSQYNSGGDAFLTTCLWTHGFGITDLDPMWHPQGLTMFDPSPPPLNPDDFIVQKAAHVLGNLLRAAAGTCQGLCEHELDHTVTLHLRARRVGGSDIAAAAFVRAISRFYASFTGRLGLSNAKQVPDATDQHAKLLAANIDARFEAAVVTMTSIAPLYMGASRGPAEDGSIEVSSDDAAFAGIASGIATRLLELMLEDARKLVEKMTPPPSPPSPTSQATARNASVDVSALLASSIASAKTQRQKESLPARRRQRRRGHRKQAARSTSTATDSYRLTNE